MATPACPAAALTSGPSRLNTAALLVFQGLVLLFYALAAALALVLILKALNG